MGGPASEQRESMVRNMPVRRPTSVESPRAINGTQKSATNAPRDAPYSSATVTSAPAPCTKGQRKVNMLVRNIAGARTFIAPVRSCPFVWEELFHLYGGG